ncbi:MAG: hypothetical protein ABL907_19490, partial [Hyphomicrobium sp.]
TGSRDRVNFASSSKPFSPATLLRAEHLEIVRMPLRGSHSDTHRAPQVKAFAPVAATKKRPDRFPHPRGHAKTDNKIVSSFDQPSKSSYSAQSLKPELRALVKAEVRRRMAGSALDHFPKLRQATEQDPELAKEAARFIFDMLDGLTTPRDEQSEPALAVDIQSIPGLPTRNQTFIDPKTKLDLLAPPAEFYRDRKNKSENPEEFLKRVWGALTRRHLLYAEHLRRSDPHLYFALHHKADVQGTRLSEYLVTLGVMTRAQVRNPPAGLERHATLMRNLRLILRSQSISKAGQLAARDV